ncbi:MAG: PKD domain-containing protein, partial [Candidatus Pacebacteria bacterium]|nr:PKD domain-containing protein [Candidatus Paceibacterota bacterium]
MNKLIAGFFSCVVVFLFCLLLSAFPAQAGTIISGSGVVIDVTPSGSPLGVRYFDFYPGTLSCPFIQYDPATQDPNSPPFNISMGTTLQNVQLLDQSGVAINSNLYTIETLGEGMAQEVHIKLTLGNPLLIAGASYTIKGTRVVSFDCVGTPGYSGFFNQQKTFSLTPITPPTPVVVTSFSASPNPILNSIKTTLSWQSTGATYCDLYPGVVGDTGQLPPSGSLQINIIPTSIDFRITCHNDTASDFQTKTVNTFYHQVRWQGYLKTSCAAATSSATRMEYGLERDVILTTRIVNIRDFPNQGLNDGDERSWGIIPATFAVGQDVYTPNFKTASNNSLYQYCGYDSPNPTLTSISEPQERFIRLYFAPPTSLTCSVSAPVSGPHLVENSIPFSASASGGTGSYSYAWSFGDGTSASGQNVSHTYPVSLANTTVTPTLTVTSGASSCTASSSLNLFAHQMRLDGKKKIACSDPDSSAQYLSTQ